MKVYLNENGHNRLIGRADIPDDHALPYFEVPLFGGSSIIMERFTLGSVTQLPAAGGITVERAVLLTSGQMPELLPEWQPLSS